MPFEIEQVRLASKFLAPLIQEGGDLSQLFAVARYFSMPVYPNDAFLLEQPIHSLAERFASEQLSRSG